EKILIVMARTIVLSEKNISYRSIDDKNALSFINAVKLGIAFPLFHSIMKNSPFSMNEWSNYLHLSARTLQRYKKERKSFDSTSTEKILEITMLCKLGLEVFGDKEKFNSWLSRKNVAL